MSNSIPNTTNPKRSPHERNPPTEPLDKSHPLCGQGRSPYRPRQYHHHFLSPHPHSERKASSMSAFDTRINVVAASVGVPTPEQLENGSTPGVEVALTIGLQLPLSPGPGEPGISANLGVV